MAKSSLPWAAYHAVMACRLVVLDKRPGVHPIGIGTTIRRALAKLVMRAGVGGTPTPPEENTDLPGFVPESAHLFLQGVYEDFLHHNDRLHLDRRIADDAAWQRHWRQFAAQSESWHATPSGTVGH